MTELSHVHYEGRKSLCYVGQSRTFIHAPPHEVLNYFWSWDNPDRRRLFNPEDTERSIVEEVTEHHRIVSSTKDSGVPFVSPRQVVLRMIWKELDTVRACESPSDELRKHIYYGTSKFLTLNFRM